MSVELFDTHCHLTTSELIRDAHRVIADAVAAGVGQMITVACRPEEFEAALALRELHPGLYVSAGVHPHDAARAGDGEFDRLEAMWGQPGVVAAGEMGLDYHYDFSPREVQRSVFERQLERVAARDLPIVIHCREAQADVVRILLKHGYAQRRVVFHCFSGTAEEAAELRGHGWWTSFTGLITFKKAGPQREACAQTPADQLMFETDSPYLSPEPVRRMRPNEPKNMVHTVRFAADLRGAGFEELAARSTANAVRFFAVPANSV